MTCCTVVTTVSCTLRQRSLWILPGRPSRLILSNESCKERRLCRCLAWLIGTSLHRIRLGTTLVLGDVPRFFHFAKSSVHYRAASLVDQRVQWWYLQRPNVSPELRHRPRTRCAVSDQQWHLTRRHFSATIAQ